MGNTDGCKTGCSISDGRKILKATTWGLSDINKWICWDKKLSHNISLTVNATSTRSDDFAPLKMNKLKGCSFQCHHPYDLVAWGR